MSEVRALTLGGGMVILDHETITAFAANVRGGLLMAGSPGYDEARQLWNGIMDKRPALIARCTGPADVIAAVNFARANNLLLAVRGGGHGVAGRAVCDGGLLIDLSLMRGVRVDPHAGTVRVQAGATLGDIDREAQVFGLAVPAGVVASTGVAGLTLTGGTGWQMRKRGLTIDNLCSVDIVTPDGALRVCSGTENADLFWALRGGGGNFGVVTSFEYQAHPVGPTVVLCCPWYPAAMGADVLRAWRDFMAAAAEEFAAIFLFWNVPANPDFPTEHHGKAVVIPFVTYIGDPEEGARLIKPLRTLGKPLFDQSGPLPWLTLQRMFDPFAPKGGLRYYWKSAYLSGLGEDVIDHLVELATTIPSPKNTRKHSHGSYVILMPFAGGAISRVGDGDTAFGRRDIPYIVELNSMWPAAADDDLNIDWTRQAWSQIQKFSLGGGYLVYPGFGEDEENLVRASVGAANYSKLVAIKDKYDPANLFRSNMNIKPTAERPAIATSSARHT